MRARLLASAAARPSAFGIGKIACPNDATGTDSSADPRAPFTLSSTRSEPYSINHRLELKNRGSVFDCFARLGTGKYCEPGPLSRATAVAISRTSPELVRTSTSATPGITCGMRLPVADYHTSINSRRCGNKERPRPSNTASRGPGLPRQASGTARSLRPQGTRRFPRASFRSVRCCEPQRHAPID
jgi:hypothetical protein